MTTKSGKTQRKDEHSEWMRSQPRSSDGTGTRHVKIINGGPYRLNDLANLFVKLDREVMDKCCVACVVDSLSTFDVDVGGASRCLGVVARRLRG